MAETAIVVSDANRELASRLSLLLADAGFATTTVADAEAIGTSAVIVVITRSALADKSWRAAVDSLERARIIPVVSGPVDDDLVPEAVAQVNWIHWLDETAAIGQLLAALNHSPDRYRISAQLAAEAQAWAEHDRDASHLASDDKRIREMQGYLAQDPASLLIPPDATTLRFVELSLKASKRKRRNKRIRRWGLALILVSVASVIVPGVVAERYERALNRATAATVDLLGLGRDWTAWATMQTATVLINGDDQTKSLAEERLRDLIAAPARRSRAITPGVSLEGATTIQDGLALVAILGSESPNDTLGIIDLRDSTLAHEVALPGQYGSVEVGPSGELIVVAGRSGAAVVDWAEQGVTELLQTESIGATFSHDGDILVTTPNVIQVFDTTGSRTAEITYDGDLLDLEVSDEGPRALLFEEPDRYRLIDPTSGFVLLDASLPPGLTPTGGVGTDGVHIYVTGPDQQIWELAPDEEPSPTGIPASDSTYLATPLPGGRLLVGSQTSGLHVFHIDSGVDLGEVCRDILNPFRVEADRDGAYVACLGPRRASTWKLPDPPLADTSLHPAGSTGEWTVEVSGESLRIVHSDRGPSPWYSPGTGEITAAALARDANHVVAGSSDGRVVLLDREGDGLALALRWMPPDHSGITAAGWADGPVVQTAAGWLWAVPECRGCSDTEGLLAAYRDMQKPCWEPGQLQAVDIDTRVALQLFKCGGES